MFCQHQDHFSDRFSMRSCPESAYILAFFAPPPPPNDTYAEIIFAHILVFPACAIEVQHINENSPTIQASSQVKTSFHGTTPEQLILRKHTDSLHSWWNPSTGALCIASRQKSGQDFNITHSSYGLARENSRHFATLPLVFPRNNV